MLALEYAPTIVEELVARGADLSMVSNDGANSIHHAAAGGHLESIKFVFNKTAIDVNSVDSTGITPLTDSLLANELGAANFLVEKGGNLFHVDADGERAIDRHIRGDPTIVLGPQVLQHAKDVRWESVRSVLNLSKACEDGDPTLAISAPSNLSDIVKQVQSARLASSVFGNSGLARHIASFLLRTEIIIRDPSIPREEDEREPDDVKRRIEASLAANASNKKARRSE